ncbi:hypothetical protein SmJEL517_g05030 [Synchytrium microbalum]|uniref:Velvet domain-containing protein n=1 Tax=Synchytrium microbalum TaxID=1806994 RepID=A0A507C2G2_9FUNG|nr:uncharacterized protein SmJEL517_g05030 [Synchytrium microbalum]TPX31725.1 hypothetical protein SmJEL517_g05030 [Synchytrium microbalum]
MYSSSIGTEGEPGNRVYILTVIQDPLRAKCWKFGQGQDRESSKPVNPPIIVQLGLSSNGQLDTSIEALTDWRDLILHSSLVNDDHEDCSYVANEGIQPQTPGPSSATGPIQSQQYGSASVSHLTTMMSPVNSLSLPSLTISNSSLVESDNGRDGGRDNASNSSSSNSLPNIQLLGPRHKFSEPVATQKATKNTRAGAINAAVSPSLAPLIAVPARSAPTYQFWRPTDQQHSPPGTGYSRALEGNLASSSFQLTDLEGRRGVFFVFAEVTVRVEGTFRLKFDLYNLNHVMPNSTFTTTNTLVGRRLATTTSARFISYSPRDYLQLQQQAESSEISKHFAEQGLVIPIRKSARIKHGMFATVATDN